MQTFLPYPTFTLSAECLDDKRLGKQRVEALQILNTLLGYSDGWKNHPAVKMWRPYLIAFIRHSWEIRSSMIHTEATYSESILSGILSLIGVYQMTCPTYGLFLPKFRSTKMSDEIADGWEDEELDDEEEDNDDWEDDGEDDEEDDEEDWEEDDEEDWEDAQEEEDDE